MESSQQVGDHEDRQDSQNDEQVAAVLLKPPSDFHAPPLGGRGVEVPVEHGAVDDRGDELDTCDDGLDAVFEVQVPYSLHVTSVHIQ